MNFLEIIIEKEDLEFMGQPITYSLIQELGALVLTLLIGVLQGLYESD